MNSFHSYLPLATISCSPALLSQPPSLPASTPLVLGQTEAAQMLRLGVAMKSHIIVTGDAGCGRKKLIEALVTEPTHNLEQDVLLLFNYEDPSQPLVLRLPAGEGVVLKQRFEHFEHTLRGALLSDYHSPALRASQQQQVQPTDQAVRDLWVEFIAPLSELGLQLALSADQSTPEIQLLWDEQPYPFIALVSALKPEELASPQWITLKNNYNAQRIELDALMVRIEAMTRQTSHTLHTLIKQSLAPIISTHCAQLIDPLSQHPAVITCIRAFEKNLLAQLHHLPLSAFEETDTLAGWVWVWHNPQLLHTHTSSLPPLLYEANPTWSHLFGSVEVKEELCLSSVKGGALLSLAHGYLIVDLEKILQDEALWLALKLAIATGKHRIENSPSASPLPGHFSTITLPLTTRLIVLSSPELYEKLCEVGDDLLALCPIVAQFTDIVPIDEQTVADYSAYLLQHAQAQHCPAPTPHAITALLQQAMILSEHRGFFTSQLHQLNQIFTLAQHHAAGHPITAEHVNTALSLQQQRVAAPIKEILRSIHSKQLFINPTGTAVGKVQALVVMDHGQVSFGCPTLITATVSAGKDGLINIEREVDLSGDLHDKGVFILEAFLRSLFAKTTPLSVTMSLCFEQSYSHVEGDSATLAETCALISVLSGVPLKQSIGITGSMNQLGELQPIGGLNEKITGFFTVCESLGLTGSQGVVFPASNLSNLMLPPPILTAIEQGTFHLWACHHLFEALELLTDHPIGVASAKGKYPKNSLFFKVEENLKILGS